MITDYDKAAEVLKPLILQEMKTTDAAAQHAAGARAAAIIDFSCQLLLEDSTTLHNAERFAAAQILNARDSNGNFSLNGIADAFIKRSIAIFQKMREIDPVAADQTNSMRVRKVIHLLLSSPAPMIHVATSKNLGTAGPATGHTPAKP